MGHSRHCRTPGPRHQSRTPRGSTPELGSKEQSSCLCYTCCSERHSCLSHLLWHPSSVHHAWTWNNPIKCFLFGLPLGLWTESAGLGDAAEFLSSSPADARSVLSRVVDRHPETSLSPTCFWVPFLFMRVYHTSHCYKMLRRGCMAFSPGTGCAAESWVCSGTSAGLVYSAPSVASDLLLLHFECLHLCEGDDRCVRRESRWLQKRHINYRKRLAPLMPEPLLSLHLPGQAAPSSLIPRHKEREAFINHYGSLWLREVCAFM